VSIDPMRRSCGEVQNALGSPRGDMYHFTKTHKVGLANHFSQRRARRTALALRPKPLAGADRNFVVRDNDPTAHVELLVVRDACRRLETRDLSDCEVFSTAKACPMCQGALYWARVRRFHTESAPEDGVAPKLAC
jgi:hypothetical protein